MKSNKYLLRLFMAAAVSGMALSSCTDNDTPDKPEEETPNTPGEENPDGKYVFATTVTTSGNSSYVLLTGDSLDEGELTTVGHGLGNEGATQWVFYKNYLYALQYNQGNAGTTRSYVLGEDGEMQARDIEYKISRFSSYGAYDDYILTMATGEGPEKFADSKGYRPMTLTVTYLDVVNETMKENNTSTGLYSMENFLGNGEYVTLSGAEQSGSKLYCGAIPMGLSQYGVADGDGKWVRPECAHLVTKESGGQGGGSYKANTLSGTQYPNECWVAIYNNADLTNPTLAKTDKISYPCGRFRSQYYQTIWAADNGDIYVFSSSFAQTMTDDNQKTKLPAGVCRIPAGSDKFDDYYCNIEAQTKGGNRSFMRCWPAGGSNFLMIMYDRPFSEAGYAATELAVFNAETKKLTYVTGLPETLSSIGKTVYTSNGYVYIPVTSESGFPAICRIETATAKATLGVTIQAADITGFGYLTPNV